MSNKLSFKIKPCALLDKDNPSGTALDCVVRTHYIPTLTPPRKKHLIASPDPHNSHIMFPNQINPPTPCFLQLPREIRDIIVEYSLLDRDPVAIELPNYPPSPPNKIRSDNKYASQKQVLLHYPFLLVNRQLRAEALQILNRRAASVYEVDILLYERERLILYMPTQNFATRIDMLYTRFYVLNDVGPKLKNRWHVHYNWDHGGAYPACWDLVKAFEWVIGAGPATAMGASSDGNVLIKTLALDICTRTGIPSSLLAPPNYPYKDEKESSTFRVREAQRNWRIPGMSIAEHPKMHPDYFLVALENMLDVVLCWPKGEVIHEHVGSIVFLLDGRRLFEWDLTEYLQEIKSRKEEKLQWRDSVMARRRKIDYFAPIPALN